MANTIKIAGDIRDEFGKGAARRMRVAKLIPATLYAGGDQPTFVKLPMKETTLALRHTNALFSISFGGQTKLAVVKDVQRNPVKRIVEHIDFYEVKAGEKIDLKSNETAAEGPEDVADDSPKKLDETKASK